MQQYMLRWRLWRVCRKLRIKPYEWQRLYALTGRCVWPPGRRQGKTTAVILWGLIRQIDGRKVAELGQRDPSIHGKVMQDCFAREYFQAWRKVYTRRKWR